MKIDLNSDLGEGYGAWSMGDDAAMLGIVSSANLACGFHAGDPLTMLATVREAAARSVAIGAHVSYPDRVGFGRRPMEVSHAELVADVIYQIGALQGICASAGTRVSYVKPHGALYNTIAVDPKQGAAVIEGIRAVDPALALMGLAGTQILAQAAEAGLPTIAEAFADRGYRPDGQLVSRRDPGAVLHDPDAVAARMLRLATEGEVEAADGSVLRLRADSICVHGDSPGAVAMAARIRAVLLAGGVTIAAFAGAAA
ncbi:LamB/YcsF family protein [Paracoccus aminovorans]|uniref:LamB/YcsF family protein n=1 Tax=Paracoccus aminovorans TaxID=34004 RepID=UPI000781F2FE|nr:5-oxoprolinase subunit PxpA [Paracoccus aminovorans]MDQ7777633.1 5-oxoprolinase subunit PxpA [Paracoccus aminovorans]